MLSYKRNGKSTGETLVLIHGFLLDHTIFSKVTPQLEEHYDVLQIELPGHGNSNDIPNEPTMDAYVDAIAEVLQHEKITDAVWLGHSMGGYITLAAMEKNAAPITKAILAYSSDAPDSSETQKKRDKQRDEIEQHGVEHFVNNSIENFFSQRAKKEDIELAKQGGYKAQQQGLLQALVAMKNRKDQRPFLAQTSIPVLVIEGEFDEAVTPVNTNNIAVRKVITQTGHIGMLEEPDAFIEAIRQFIG